MIGAEVAAGDIAAYLDVLGLRPSVLIDGERCVVRSVDRPESAHAGTLSWLRSGRPLPSWRGSVLITSRAHRPSTTPQHPWALISVDDPRLAMVHVLRRWFVSTPPRITVHPTARIHPSVVIGESDAGYVWTGERYELFPHVGGVDIGEHVEIDPLTVVSRAAIGSTRIGAGTKIGPQVTVGHGSHIGKHCILVAQVCLAGSTVLGDRVTMWQRSTTKSGIRIGDGAVIGAGSVVLEDVPAGETWAGVPARRIRGADGK